MKKIPSTLKGIIVSIFIAIPLLALYIFRTGFVNLDQYGLILFLLPAFLLNGLCLGFAANRIKTKRFVKLTSLGLALIYITSILLSFVLILNDSSKPTSFFEAIASTFFLATVGFVMFSFLLIPVLLIGVFVLERWTRE